MKPTMTIFPTRSRDGSQLLEAVLALARELGFESEFVKEPTQRQVTWACIRQDVVVIDGTVEPDGSHNYAAMTAQPLAMDHVLVVSRSHLPSNFHGLREGGAPSYPLAHSNPELVAWLRAQLEELAPSLPRPWWKKNALGSVVGVFTDPSTAGARARAGPQIFVSFRSRDFDAVQKLRAKTESGAFHDGTTPRVLVLRPGELAYQDEVLSAHQRWHILSLIEERLRGCRELWVYEGEGYYDSWWTRGELVLLAYFQAVSGRRPQLSVCRAGDDSRPVLEPEGVVPEMSYEQRRAVDRLLSNTGRSMGAETSRRTRELAQLPVLRNYRFFTDPVFSLSFLNERLLEEERDPAGAGGTPVDVERFLEMNDPPLRPVPRAVLDEVDRNGAAEHAGYSIRAEATPRYLWYATRLGRVNGPEDTGEKTIARQTVYRAARLAA